jgi:DNA-binding GntR family transcriptional regulator
MSIAASIKHDLRARISSGQELPADLTLGSLAKHYGVSFTPVREAVEDLVAEGFLSKGSNRRLTAVTGSQLPTDMDTFAPEPLPAPQRDVLKLVEYDVVHLSIKGEAIYLREEAAAERFGVSRSAMRNVFHELAGRGLLKHVPRCGWQVRPLRQEDVQGFLEVREMFEIKALELAQPRLEMRRIREILDRNVLPKTPGEKPQVDDSFHRYIIEQAGNHCITDFFERHGRYFEILFLWESKHGDVEKDCETVRQHRQILEAILQQDWPAAKAALSWHIRWNYPLLIKIVASGT